jgi:hypothetical protein
MGKKKSFQVFANAQQQQSPLETSVRISGNATLNSADSISNELVGFRGLEVNPNTTWEDHGGHIHNQGIPFWTLDSRTLFFLLFFKYKF